MKDYRPATGADNHVISQKKEYRKIESLFLWSSNPREITKKSFKSLIGKIKRWGQLKPLLITEVGEVIGGNMRLRAYKELKIEDVWVSIVNPKNDVEKLEIAMVDNESSGRWDEQLLAELVEPHKLEIDLEDYCLDFGKLTPLSELLNNLGPSDGEKEPKEVECPDCGCKFVPGK